jgi:hypothetical protein
MLEPSTKEIIRLNKYFTSYVQCLYYLPPFLLCLDIKNLGHVSEMFLPPLSCFLFPFSLLTLHNFCFLFIQTYIHFIAIGLSVSLSQWCQLMLVDLCRSYEYRVISAYFRLLIMFPPTDMLEKLGMQQDLLKEVKLDN